MRSLQPYSCAPVFTPIIPHVVLCKYLIDNACHGPPEHQSDFGSPVCMYPCQRLFVICCWYCTRLRSMNSSTLCILWFVEERRCTTLPISLQFSSLHRIHLKPCWLRLVLYTNHLLQNHHGPTITVRSNKLFLSAMSRTKTA